MDWITQNVSRYGFDAFIRMAATSAVVNGALFLLALGEIAIGFEGWQTFAVNTPLGTAVSFFLNRSWAFSGRARPKGQLFRYIATYLVTYLGAMVCAEMLERLGIPAAWAVFLTLGFFAVVVFLSLNLWVFPQRRPATEASARSQSERL